MGVNMNIKDISDIYLNYSSPYESFVFPGPISVSSNAELKNIIDGLIDQVSQIDKEKSDFRATVGEVRFRGAKIPSIEGDFFIFRKMPSEVWPLDQCGLPVVARKMILDPRLNKGGLIVISGMPGNGKSTTCASIVAERLRMHGGVCNTIEDPAEMPLQGFHGDGFCIQREVERGNSAYEAVVDTLRAYPAKQNTMMLIGEVRDASTAALALQSAVDGRLVIFTTHAGSVIETVRRVINLASGPGGMAFDQAKELFAAAFRLVIHQKLIDGRLRVNLMADSHSAASTIRQAENLDLLKNSLAEQLTKFKKGEVIELRKV